MDLRDLLQREVRGGSGGDGRDGREGTGGQLAGEASVVESKKSLK